MTVDFYGCEIEVEFEREPYEPDNGLWGCVENVKAFYGDCEVTDIILAVDKYLDLKMMIDERLT